jgi:hypothetical protein
MDADQRLRVALATIASYAIRAGAEHVVALLDRGDGSAVVIDHETITGVFLVAEDEDEPQPVELDPRVGPAELPELRAIPATALHPEPESGRVSGPIGAVSHMADGLLALAAALGGRSVATADFPTHDPRTPITLAARVGEPVVLDLGGEQYLLPDLP